MTQSNEDSQIEYCPHCDVSLRGDEIPEDIRKWYGGKTHYSNKIGMEIPGVYDGVLFWQCPFCLGKWHRFNEAHPLHYKAEPYVDGQAQQA